MTLEHYEMLYLLEFDSCNFVQHFFIDTKYGYNTISHQKKFMYTFTVWFSYFSFISTYYLFTMFIHSYWGINIFNTLIQNINIIHNKYICYLKIYYYIKLAELPSLPVCIGIHAMHEITFIDKFFGTILITYLHDGQKE